MSLSRVIDSYILIYLSKKLKPQPQPVIKLHHSGDECSNRATTFPMGIFDS